MNYYHHSLKNQILIARKKEQPSIFIYDATKKNCSNGIFKKQAEHHLVFVYHIQVVRLHPPLSIVLSRSTGEGLQKLGLCWAFRAFKQGGIFIVPYLL